MILQLLMAVAVIFFPALVTGNKERREKVDIDSIRTKASRGGAYPGNQVAAACGRMFNPASQQ